MAASRSGIALQAGRQAALLLSCGDAGEYVLAAPLQSSFAVQGKWLSGAGRRSTRLPQSVVARALQPFSPYWFFR